MSAIKAETLLAVLVQVQPMGVLFGIHGIFKSELTQTIVEKCLCFYCNLEGTIKGSLKSFFLNRKTNNQERARFLVPEGTPKCLLWIFHAHT